MKNIENGKFVVVNKESYAFIKQLPWDITKVNLDSLSDFQERYLGELSVEDIGGLSLEGEPESFGAKNTYQRLETDISNLKAIFVDTTYNEDGYWLTYLDRETGNTYERVLDENNNAIESTDVRYGKVIKKIFSRYPNGDIKSFSKYENGVLITLSDIEINEETGLILTKTNYTKNTGISTVMRNTYDSKNRIVRRQITRHKEGSLVGESLTDFTYGMNKDIKIAFDSCKLTINRDGIEGEANE